MKHSKTRDFQNASYILDVVRPETSNIQEYIQC